MMAKTNHLGALAAVAVALMAVGSLMLVMLVVEARPAEATFPGKPGEIAYRGNPGTDLEIYTIKAGGGSGVNITDNTLNDYEPCYSPDGKKIVYSGFDGNDYEIRTINAGGGGMAQLTHNGTEDSEPS